MKKPRILVFGDAMLDRYIIGDTVRISPEAPVPVLTVKNEYNTLGGAANVAHNLINVGIENDLLAGIGADESGHSIQALLTEKGIGDKLQTVLETTTTKTRIISRNQQMIRIDREGALQTKVGYSFFKEADLKNYSVSIISDYGKGMCEHEIVQGIIKEAAERGTKVLVDPKGMNWEKYRGAYLVKPNIAELEEIMGFRLENNDEEIVEVCKTLIKKYDLKNMVATRGDKGMILVNEQTVHFFRAKKVEVYDVSGAGDTAIAILAYGLISGYNLENSILMANLASTFVVTRPQTYAIKKDELVGLTSKIVKG